MICANEKCQQEFRRADRASPLATAGAVNQILYCSETCARSAENRRYYLAHRAEIIERVSANQRAATK